MEDSIEFNFLFTMNSIFTLQKSTLFGLFIPYLYFFILNFFRCSLFIRNSNYIMRWKKKQQKIEIRNNSFSNLWLMWRQCYNLVRAQFFCQLWLVAIFNDKLTLNIATWELSSASTSIRNYLEYSAVVGIGCGIE